MPFLIFCWRISNPEISGGDGAAQPHAGNRMPGMGLDHVKNKIKKLGKVVDRKRKKR